MAISKEKMKIVINNYFKAECDVNTSIREAFEKGFRIGVEKGYVQARTEQIEPSIEKIVWHKDYGWVGEPKGEE